MTLGVRSEMPVNTLNRLMKAKFRDLLPYILCVATVLGLAYWLKANSVILLCFGAGVIAGTLFQHKPLLSFLVAGGAVGGALGGLAGGELQLVLDPPEHWLIGPVMAGLIYLFWGCVGGIIAGALVFALSRTILRDSFENDARSRILCVVSTGCLLTVAIAAIFSRR